MIKLTDKIWIGNSEDGILLPEGVEAVLNVAQDLAGKCGWPTVDYAQIGLIDGPGNPLSLYYAAVLQLSVMIKRHQSVLIYCHTGSRSLAVAIMYLSVSHISTWDWWIAILQERVGDIPIPHDAHHAAFDKMDWKALANMVNS